MAFRWAAVVVAFVGAAQGAEPIRLAKYPSLSPDGARIAFEWNGDLWTASSAGGEATPLTANPARDSQPRFSPDGKEIAFLSDREGTVQAFLVPASGGTPRQVTVHTGGYDQIGWTPAGKLLVRAMRDAHWKHAERFFVLDRNGKSPEIALFDDYGSDGQLSPDGTKLLFTREGEGWWRKGYQGARTAQVWLYDLSNKAFEKVLHRPYGCRWPMWRPDGKAFYYVEEHANGANLFLCDLASKSTKQLTAFPADSVVFPSIARDGTAIAFRHLFDLYRYSTTTGELRKLDLFHNADRAVKPTESRTLSTATAAAFSADGLDVAMIAGGDLWVMDTELREPIAVTKSAAEESSPIFGPDGQSLYFVAAEGEKHVLCRAKRADAKKHWWQNKTFVIERVVQATEPIARLQFSPDGKNLAYVRGRGDLWIADADGANAKKFLAGWNTPDFDFSPDGTWIVYAVHDNDFNRDVFVAPLDGKTPAFNLSRHPYVEGAPVWSPDGKSIAFAGRRIGEAGEQTANVAIVRLRPEDDDRTERDRKLEKALDKMKGRAAPAKVPEKKEGEPAKAELKDAPKLIDFDGLHERVRRVAIREGGANALFWSPDSKKLAFTGSVDSKTGTYAIDVGETLTIKPLVPETGSQPRWLKQGNQIVWLVSGTPTSTPGTASAAPAPTPAPSVTLPTKGKFPVKGPTTSAAPTPAAPSSGASYTFSVRQDYSPAEKNGAVFDECWRIMRDHWYDGKHNNRDWSAVRARYLPMARDAVDSDTLVTVVQMMLGELNGSHLGFTLGQGDPTKLPVREGPRDATGHLGVRFDPAHAGPGLKIRDVLPKSPADRPRSRLRPGETLAQIDGVDVGPASDLASLLTGPLDRERTLTVKGVDGAVRIVPMRLMSGSPTSLAPLLYEQWLERNRKAVEAASGGKLGYLHISAMSMPTFRKFEEELVSQGAGKDGLVIDVRENPGGSTADHLLTALTQPVHAITVPRGGGEGYPQDRKVFVTWNKPIVVLCNQNSGSNAEIFSHAVRTLKRGQVVGVPTAGAVVSTGAVGVMDVGMLRLPFRGWFTIGDGEDMEKNGAMPHHVLWPHPGDLPAGRDAQLTKAIEVLQADVAAWRARPRPALKFSTDR